MELPANQRLNFEEGITIPNNMAYTAPYWLNNQSTLGMYSVEYQDLIGLPETPRAVFVDFNFKYRRHTYHYYQACGLQIF